MQGPAGSTRVRQPRDLNRGHLGTPAPGKLRLTRRAWLLLWLTATLIAVVDGGLLLRGASVTVMVEGRSTPVPAGLTTGQVLGRLGAAGMAGDLLAVDRSVLRKGAFPPKVLVNGQPASAARRLGRGDRISVARGRTRTEPVAPGNPTACRQPARQPDPVASDRAGPGRPGPRATVWPPDTSHVNLTRL